jgi:hypothetical protein
MGRTKRLDLDDERLADAAGVRQALCASGIGWSSARSLEVLRHFPRFSDAVVEEVITPQTLLELTPFDSVYLTRLAL